MQTIQVVIEVEVIGRVKRGDDQPLFSDLYVAFGVLLGIHIHGLYRSLLYYKIESGCGDGDRGIVCVMTCREHVTFSIFGVSCSILCLFSLFYSFLFLLFFSQVVSDNEDEEHRGQQMAGVLHKFMINDWSQFSQFAFIKESIMPIHREWNVVGRRKVNISKKNFISLLL